MQYLLALFSETGLAPHGFCLLWQPGLIWLHVVSDAIIGTSYYAIPVALAYFVWHRADIAFGWIFWMFAAFIIACGTTHFFEIWVLWHPDYGLQGLIKAVTALASIATAAALWPLLPRALALPSLAEFRNVNERLSAEVAEHRRFEEGLRRSEESFRYLFQKSPNVMWVVDRETLRFLQVNELAMRIYGYSEEEFLRMRVTDIRPPDEVPQLLSLYRDDSSDFRTTGPWRHILKSGKTLHAEVSATSMIFGGHPTRLAVVRDVSERVAADRALKQSEEKYRNLIEGSIQGVFIHDNGRPLFANHAFATIFGYETPQQVLSLASDEALISPEDRKRVNSYRQAEMRGEAAPLSYEVRGIRRDGKAIWLEIRSRAIEWNGSFAIQATVVDISDRKRTEEQLRQSQKVEAIGQLTGGIAHDFNNLLAVIIGNAEALESPSASGRRSTQELARTILNAADQAASLTNRLLAFARKQPLDPKPTDLQRFTEGLAPMLRRTLGEDVEVKLEIAPELWKVKVDRHQLEASLLNLAINSRDAMPRGGSITIAAANSAIDEGNAAMLGAIHPGEYVQLSITDDGEGIAPENLDRVVEPFFTTKPAGKGTGLGLSMVYGFAKQSDGHMSIHSEVGKGTTVHLYLPRAQEAGAGAGQSDRPADSIPAGSETILLVEDNAAVREMSAAMLTGFGYVVLQAATGRQAIGIIERGQAIDLLFTDVVMPGGMNGRELADEARRRRPGIRVLYTSGYTASAFTEENRPDEGPDLLQKPYRRQELARAVRAALDRTEPRS